jgi:hypothetical protein
VFEISCPGAKKNIWETGHWPGLHEHQKNRSVSLIRTKKIGKFITVRTFKKTSIFWCSWKLGFCCFEQGEGGGPLRACPGHRWGSWSPWRRPWGSWGSPSSCPGSRCSPCRGRSGRWSSSWWWTRTPWNWTARGQCYNFKSILVRKQAKKMRDFDSKILRNWRPGFEFRQGVRFQRRS